MISLFARLFRPIIIRLGLKVPVVTKCPACGAVLRHDLRYHPAYKMLQRTCKACAAIWLVKPVMPPEGWAIQQKPMSPDDQNDILAVVAAHNREMEMALAQQTLVKKKAG
jgi:Fe-S oxidoreductase